MKKTLLLILTMLSMLVTLPVNAASTPLKIGIIDMSQILQKAPLMVSLNADLVKKFKSRQEEINTANKNLQDEANQLQYNSDAMSQADKLKLQNKVIADKANLQILDASFQRDLTMAKDQAMQDFMAKFNDVIAKIAKEGNYDLIEQRTNIDYVNEQLDITNEVLKQLG